MPVTSPGVPEQFPRQTRCQYGSFRVTDPYVTLSKYYARPRKSSLDVRKGRFVRPNWHCLIRPDHPFESDASKLRSARPGPLVFLPALLLRVLRYRKIYRSGLQVFGLVLGGKIFSDESQTAFFEKLKRVTRVLSVQERSPMRWGFGATRGATVARR